MIAFTRYSTRSLASSPSTGSPTNVWINRHSVIAARPTVTATSRNLPNGCSATVANAPDWFTCSLPSSPRANWIARTPSTRYSTPRVVMPARANGSRHAWAARRPLVVSVVVMGDRLPRGAACRTSRRSGARRACLGHDRRVPAVTVIVDDEPAARAAREIVRLLAAAVEQRGRASLAVSGGSTGPGLLAALATAGLPWAHVGVWQVDERVAPEGDASRNASQLDGFPGEIHLMPVTAPNLVRAAAAYAAELPDRFDVVHLGMGADGHTASWPPGDPVIHSTRPVDLSGEYQGRVRMTLTPPVVDTARARVVLITGADKAAAVAGWIEGPRRGCRSSASRRPARPSSSMRPPPRSSRRLPRRAHEARHRVLDVAASALGHPDHPHAAAAQRRGSVGDRRALPTRPVGARLGVHRRPRQPVPTDPRARRTR